MEIKRTKPNILNKKRKGIRRRKKKTKQTEKEEEAGEKIGFCPFQKKNPAFCPLSQNN